MTISKHALERQTSRGIKDRVIQVALEFGKQVDSSSGRILLNRKMLWKAVSKGWLSSVDAKKLERSVPVVLVASENTLVGQRQLYFPTNDNYTSLLTGEARNSIFIDKIGVFNGYTRQKSEEVNVRIPKNREVNYSIFES